MFRGYRFCDGDFPDRVILRDLDGTYETDGTPLGVFLDAEGEGRRSKAEGGAAPVGWPAG